MSISIKGRSAPLPLLAKFLRRHQLGAGACKFGECGYTPAAIEVDNCRNHCFPLGLGACEANCVRKLASRNINRCFHAVMLSNLRFYFYPFRNIGGGSAPAGLKSFRPALFAVARGQFRASAKRTAFATCSIFRVDRLAIGAPSLRRGTVCKWSQFTAHSRGGPSSLESATSLGISRILVVNGATVTSPRLGII